MKLPPSGSSSSKISGGTAPTNEEVNKLQQDLILLTQKIADLTGEPQRAPPTPSLDGPANAPNSPFVSGLRGMADSGSNSSGSSVDALRLTMTEKVLKKVMELDRVLLKKTAPETDGTTRARRGSRGMDLFTLPTHLHITDRLLDLHQRSTRVVTVMKGAAAPESSAPEGPPPVERRPTLTPPAGNATTSSPRPSAIEKKLKEEITALKTKLGDSETKRAAVKEDCSQARKDNLMYKKQLEDLNKTHEELTLKLANDNSAKRIKELEEQIKELTNQYTATQERLEEEVSRSMRIVEAVSQRASSITSNHAE